VQEESWPPEGVLRQTQIFDCYVAPLLQERGKVAFFLADALRFEMGCDLAEALSEIGAVEMLAEASVLPASTSHGMAVLMPNADSTFKLVDAEGDFSPALGT
jgi:PglZ domain